MEKDDQISEIIIYEGGNGQPLEKYEQRRTKTSRIPTQRHSA